MPNGSFEHRKGILIFSIISMLLAAVTIGIAAGFFFSRGYGAGPLLIIALLLVVPFLSYLLYKKMIFPYYRRLEDSNLELHLKHEELLDIKDDLFIKFLGIYDVNYAANSPRMFKNRMQDVADITARVMEADACFIFLYERKKDELVLQAANKYYEDKEGNVRIPLGEGIEGWVGRRLEPVMSKDFLHDARFREISGLVLANYTSLYCFPLYVHSNGALVGVMEVLYSKVKNFTDEEINFFTTLSGIIATTVQNEQMQLELRKMNMELEQWVAEKTEELRASEERYRTLVENACESIFVLADNGDIVFANEQAARLTGYSKYDLLHKNFFELLVEPGQPKGILSGVTPEHQSIMHGSLRQTDGTVVPVEVSVVGLLLMGKRFVQSVVRDMSSRVRLEKLLEEKEREISVLMSKLKVLP
jgi:PAS domain S-box-containing protein